MILEQQITSTNESINISFKILKKLIGLPFLVSISIDDENFKEFTTQWNKKRREIQDILN